MRIELYAHRTNGRYQSGKRVWLFVKARRRSSVGPFLHIEIGPYVIGANKRGVW